MRMAPELLADLLALTQYAGSNLLLAQAAGGNQSVKDELNDCTWVKASGIRMDAVSEHSGLVGLRTSAVRDLVRHPPEATYSRQQLHEWSVRQTMAASLDPKAGRASLESGFHALLGRVVLHLHPVYLNAFACMKGGYELLADSVHHEFLWIPYATPGQELAVKIDQSLSKHRDLPSICCVLANHGFISSGNTARDVIGITRHFTDAGQRVFGEVPSDLLVSEPPNSELQRLSRRIRSVLEGYGIEAAVKPAGLAAFNTFAKFENLSAQSGPLVPDDVIFSGVGIRISSAAEVIQLVEDSLPNKLAIAVRGYGTILIAPNERLLCFMEETLLAHILVRMLIARRGTPITLSCNEVEYLNNMESEKYRIALTREGSA